MLPIVALAGRAGRGRGRPAGPVERGGGGLVAGTGRRFGSVGFGAILTFSSLLFAGRGWSPVWLPFSAFGAALILARVLGGHLPDRLGGARVALACALVEAAGLALIWLAPGRVPAAVGAGLAGFGYSLVYPGLGVEAIRRARRRAAGSPWAPSRPASIWRWGSPGRGSGCSGACSASGPSSCQRAGRRRRGRHLAPPAAGAGRPMTRSPPSQSGTSHAARACHRSTAPSLNGGSERWKSATRPQRP